MIPLRRGAEPPALQLQRRWRIARLALEWLDAEVEFHAPEQIVDFVDQHSTQIDGGYAVVRDELRDRCNRKCAYCEGEVASSDPLDHFRPRRPRREQSHIVHTGYWWLTWSWTNLLLSCTTCNTVKSNSFPVTGRRLCPWTTDTASEQVGLLDPAAVDPQLHLEFSEDPNGRWTLQGTHPLGVSTARTLGLDQPSDRYDSHLQTIEEHVADLQRCAETEPERLESEWRTRTRRLLELPHMRFRSLTRAYLSDRLAPLIAEHGLTLPGLGIPSDADPDPDPLFPEEDRFLGVANDLELRLRALGPRPELAATRAAVIALVELGPRTLDELATALQLSSATVRRHVALLDGEGSLVLDGQQVRAASSPA